MRSDINAENIEKVIEKLKYSSNKMTKILTSELQKRGLAHNQSNISIIPEYTLNPEETQKQEKNTRNTLNARIVMLEHLAKEFKTNPAFQGEQGKENQTRVILHIQNVATTSSDVWRTTQMLQKKYGINIQEEIAGILNATTETQFKLKPETIEQIEKEDFDVSYDNKALIEQVKKAVNVPVKTKIKNQILKLKNQIFRRKTRMLLPERTDSERQGKIVPPNDEKLREEEYQIEGVWDLKKPDVYSKNIKDSSNPKSNSWELTEEKKKEIAEKNLKIAEKYHQEQLKGNNQNKDYYSIKRNQESRE